MPRSLFLRGLEVRDGLMRLSFGMGDAPSIADSRKLRTLADGSDELETVVSDGRRTFTARVLVKAGEVTKVICSSEAIPDDWHLPKE